MPAPGEPFAGVLSGSVSFGPQQGPTEACPLPVRTITDASGPTTIGDVTLHAELCLTIGLPTVPMGVRTLTTEDGDELTGVYFIDCDPVLPSAESGELVTSTWTDMAAPWHLIDADAGPDGSFWLLGPPGPLDDGLRLTVIRPEVSSKD
jgi:hypothetical protein